MSEGVHIRLDSSAALGTPAGKLGRWVVMELQSSHHAIGSLEHSRRTLWEGRGLMEMNVNTSTDNPNSVTIVSPFVVRGSLTYVDLLKVQCKWDHGLFPRSPWTAPLTLTRLIMGTGCGSQGAYNVGIPHLSLIPYQRQWIDHIIVPKYSYTINVVQRGGFFLKKS